jgi:lipopolysaccharide export system permease protein
VPLSHLGPRAGRYSKLVWGIVAYLIYSNLLGLGQAMLKQGAVPPSAGLWWVHGVAVISALWLIQSRSRGLTGRTSAAAGV